MSVKNHVDLQNVSSTYHMKHFRTTMKSNEDYFLPSFSKIIWLPRGFLYERSKNNDILFTNLQWNKILRVNEKQYFNLSTPFDGINSSHLVKILSIIRWSWSDSSVRRMPEAESSRLYPILFWYIYVRKYWFKTHDNSLPSECAFI